MKILDIRNSTGAIACALFESPEGFPTNFLKLATNIMMIKIRDTQARCDFLDIPPGTYALAVIHDEDMDGELATNWLGVPTEGYGFSNDAEGTMSAPTFEAASFPYDGQNLDLTVTLSYCARSARVPRDVRSPPLFTCRNRPRRNPPAPSSEPTLTRGVQRVTIRRRSGRRAVTRQTPAGAPSKSRRMRASMQRAQLD